MQSVQSPQFNAERRRRLELDVGDDRAEHDPGSVPARDQHRVLPVEADTASHCGLAVDVLVRVDEHPIRAAELRPELLQLAAELCIRVVPGVPRQAPLSVGPVGLGRVVTKRRGDDGAGAGKQRLRMTRALRLRHGELHVGEEPARATVEDVALRFLVRDGWCRPDGVEPERLRRAVPDRSAVTWIVCRPCRRFVSTKTAVPTCSCSKRCPTLRRVRATC